MLYALQLVLFDSDISRVRDAVRSTYYYYACTTRDNVQYSLVDGTRFMPIATFDMVMLYLLTTNTRYCRRSTV